VTKTIAMCCLFVIGFIVSCGWAEEVYNVNKSGRMVQLDGFLLEWNRDSAKALTCNSCWMWDAINTREGLTGYFKTLNRPKCNRWTFKFFPGKNAVILSTSPNVGQSLCKVIQSDVDSSISAEWIIPWDKITIDQSGAYRIEFTASDTCGDTLVPIIFKGHKVFGNKKNSYGNIYIFAGTAAAFFLLFLLLRKYIKSGKR
jgi:hypothetical protein